jgi:hypothetical protein
VALVKSRERWVCFDDDQVHLVTKQQVQSTFGHTREMAPREETQGSSADHAYILLYQKAGLEGGDGMRAEDRSWDP